MYHPRGTSTLSGFERLFEAAKADEPRTGLDAKEGIGACDMSRFISEQALKWGDALITKKSRTTEVHMERPQDHSKVAMAGSRISERF